MESKKAAASQKTASDARSKKMIDERKFSGDTKDDENGQPKA